MRTYVFLALFFFANCYATACIALAQSDPSALFESPTLSRNQIAFIYGGNIWTVDRGGGNAHRLVTGYGLASRAIFSPDGSMVAFSGKYDGNVDVYVVPAEGGEPRRLTYHPSDDIVVGWTPDSKRILFRSDRTSYSVVAQLYTVPVTGGFPAELPLPMAEEGSYSPDGSHLAYVPTPQWEPFWRGYRGGQTTPIWIADLSNSHITRVPRTNSNDRYPMWVGRTVYFLSDRDGSTTLYGYDTGSAQVARLVDNHGFDIVSASAGPGAIVYAQFGEPLKLYDLAARAVRTVPISIAADMPQIRPHWEKVADQIQNASISPTGARAVFEAHGDILTVPAEHGDIRNITNTPGAAERDPAWSPDGRWIAYFSDASGEYTLRFRDQRGIEPARVINLSSSPSYFYTPTWSPDSKKIAYMDTHLNLWYVDIEKRKPVKIATEPYANFGPPDYALSWSPDSRWLAYTNLLSNYLHAVFVYSLRDERSRQITDALSDARYPAFDKNGRYLYFAASTNTALTTGGLDMTSDQHPVSSGVYVLVLRSNLGSPLKPQSSDETVTEPSPSPSASATPSKTSKSAAKPAVSPTPEKTEAEESNVRIDFDGIPQRILSLPIPEANYVALFPGDEGQLLLLRAPLTTIDPNPPKAALLKFDFDSRKATTLVDGVLAAAVSFNGKKVLFHTDDGWYITSTAEPTQPGQGAIATDRMEVFVDPRRQWAQMYDETWRIERDFFYDPHYHGLNLATAKRQFHRYLAAVASRDDLTYLFREMLSYMSVGHMFVRDGFEPTMPNVSVGLLGADYAVENGHYKFTKIYNGENWNTDLRAPLTQPGGNVKAGEYLLAVNGHELRGSDEVYSFFEETAGKQTVIRVGPNQNDEGSREITVVPVESEAGLRNLDWIEGNRRFVDRASNGKLAYVYLPDTAFGGFTNFNRYFFAQIGKQGAIIDERFNQGGQVADYIIDYLMRKPLSIIEFRDGKTVLDPILGIYGPKVMIINQMSGSGGDALPWYFRKTNIGPLVGVRTWGGLVGIGGYPVLMDGGGVTAPRGAIGGLHGQWEVENQGIPPDIEVWQDPELTRRGHDPQLEAAVAKALEMLAQHPLPKYTPPPYPNHHPVIPQ